MQRFALLPMFCTKVRTKTYVPIRPKGRAYNVYVLFIVPLYTIDTLVLVQQGYPSTPIANTTVSPIYCDTCFIYIYNLSTST